MTTEKKCVAGQNGHCCSTVEQVSWKKGGQGMRDELASGWKVSQVEALIDLPRRDIQRACYEGPGGIGIVRPQNTSWGWACVRSGRRGEALLAGTSPKAVANARRSVPRVYAERRQDGLG